MKRNTTDQNLSVITDRNSGRRSSLVISDDFESDDKSSEPSSSEEISSEKKARSPDPKDVHVVAQKIRQIDSDHKTVRLRKKKQSNQKHSSNTVGLSKDNEQFRSQFGDIQFLEAPTTIFDADSFKNSQFHGIYIMFWLSTGLLLFNKMVHAYLDDTYQFFNGPVVQILKKDIVKIGLTDLVMYLGMYFAYMIQWLCQKKVISWAGSGWVIMSIYEVGYVIFWLVFASNNVMDYHWLGRIFLMLHSLVMLMKMHSYAFYNGYLWKIFEELSFSNKYLARIENKEVKVPEGVDIEKTKSILRESIKFCQFELRYQTAHNSIYTDPNIEASEKVAEFPKNINLSNFFEYTMFPSLVYTLNFPRTKRIRKSYVFEKVCGIFGVIFLMVVVAEQGFYPLTLKANELKQLPLAERATPSLLILLDMIPHFILEYILVFFLIWEFILNSVAELSKFADRDFYGPWWACTTFEEFARIWNRPVHKFLLRHVYHSSISAFKLNKIQAGIFTFIISSIFHELAMYIIFQVPRGYLLLFQLFQLPLIMFSNTSWMKNKKVLGNVICWIGFTVGPSIIFTLYLVY